MKVTTLTCLQINCTEVFQNAAFRAWLSVAAFPGSYWRAATWHLKGKPGEFSDVFLTYEDGKGSDFHGEGMPCSIPAIAWELISQAVEEATGSRQGHYVLWLTNLYYERQVADSNSHYSITRRSNWLTAAKHSAVELRALIMEEKCSHQAAVGSDENGWYCPNCKQPVTFETEEEEED